MWENNYLTRTIGELLDFLDLTRKDYIEYAAAALREGRYDYAYERFDHIVELDHTHSAIIEFCEANTAHSTGEGVEDGN